METNINSSYIISSASLEGIKSKYIFNKIFNNLQEKKLLEIIKYNKSLQTKLNKDINDYKNFLKIEIEVIPAKYEYGEFINIKEAKRYYHIYFNDNKEETEKNYITKDDEVTKIKIIIDQDIKSLNGLFRRCKCIEKINVIKFNRKDFTDMSFMFSNCSLLKEINMNNFITDSVTSMYSMFADCFALKKLDASKFKTDNVKIMSYMFNKCSSLEELNLSSFDTRKVWNMCYMFYECKSLKYLNLSNFKTDNIFDMSYMFHGCSSLKEIVSSNELIKIMFKKHK